jgi:hypothetical protein
VGIVVVVYSLLFMEWGKEGEEHPFEDVSILPRLMIVEQY